MIHELAHASLVLPDDVIQAAQEYGHLFLLSYQKLAELAHASGRKSYHMRPKVHELDHIVDDLSIMKLNPVWLDCMDDEDFMGKLKKMGQHIHGKSFMMRLQQRYAMYLKIRWAKASRAPWL